MNPGLSRHPTSGSSTIPKPETMNTCPSQWGSVPIETTGTAGARRPFAALASDRVADLHLFFDGTQSLPLYRYTEEGERVSNITDWGLKRVNDH